MAKTNLKYDMQVGNKLSTKHHCVVGTC